MYENVLFYPDRIEVCLCNSHKFHEPLLVQYREILQSPACAIYRHLAEPCLCNLRTFYRALQLTENLKSSACATALKSWLCDLTEILEVSLPINFVLHMLRFSLPASVGLRGHVRHRVDCSWLPVIDVNFIRN